MSVETDLRLTLKAEDQASAVVRAFRNELDLAFKAAQKLANVSIAGPGLKAATKANIAPRAADPFRLDPKAAAALKSRFQAEASMTKQRERQAVAEDRQRRQFESAAIRDLRARMAATARITRQRLAEIGAVERATKQAADAAERDAASTLRRQIAGDRWRFQLRNRMDRQERTDRERARKETIGRGRDAWSHGRDAIRDTTRPAGVAALAGSAAAGAAARKILSAESSIDSAEINTRIYGQLDQDAARRLRDDWASPLAESLGSQTDKLLTAWVDATKLGIPAAGAKAFAELSTKTSEAWSVPFEAVTDILGTVNTLLTSKGEAFSADRLQSVANTLQHLAAKQSTTPEKLMSYLQRGAGAAQVLGMSQEAGLAFGSASTSLGNQAGQSGRMFDYIASRVIEMPRLTKQTGDTGKQARELVQALGYGSAEAMDHRRRTNPDAFLPDFMERFGRIKDTKKQDQAIRFFTGREWLGEFGRMVKGIDTYREAVKLQKEAKGLDAIGAVWELHRTKLGFVFKQFRAGWLNILGEFGKVISPMARQAGDYFLGWSANLRSGGLAARFKASVEGFINGLGFKNLPALLEGVLGKPGEGNAGSIKAWGDAARGFGAGLRDAGAIIKGLFSVFTAGDTSPETVGRWTARILALSAALVILSPVLTVLGGLASAILAIGTAAAATFSALKVANIVGSTAGRTVSGLGLVASRLVGGLVGGLGLAIVAELGARRGEIATLMLDATKGLFASMVQGIRDALAEWKQGGIVNGVLRFLDPNFAPDPAKAPQPETAPKAPTAPQAEIGADRGVMDRVLDWFRGAPPAPATTWRDPPAKVEKQSSTDDWRGLIQPASLRVVDDLAGSVDRLGRVVGSLGARAQLASIASPSSAPATAFGAPGAGVPASFSSTYGGGSGGGRQVPGWYGGGGSGTIAPTFKGNQKAIAKTAFEFFRGKGLSAEAASGILASMDAESSFNPSARGDGGKAHGLFQHHPDRRAAIMGATGIDMSTATPEKQLEGAWWEMNHGDAGAQRALAMLRRPGISAREAGAAFVQHFERPRKDERATRGSMAEGFNREFGNGAPAPGGPAGPVVGGVHPLDGKGRFTSDFGMRRHPITGQHKLHAGVDLAAPAGTIVKAMRDGIASIDRSGDVKVAHDDGSSTTYRHIQAGIEAGAKVAAGQAIGRLRAQDPRSTGPHLHLEARDAKGGLIDPKRLLSAAPVSPGAGPKAEDAMKGFTSTGWRKAGEIADQVAPAVPPTAADLAAKVPMPATRGGAGAPGLDPGGSGFKPGAGGNAGAGGPTTVHIHQTIHGAGERPNELAGKVQRHITEAWNYRAHDLEPELT